MTMSILETRFACEAALRGRATADAAFRASLISDPAAALGGALPEGLTIRVLEEAPGEVLLVLPAVSDQLSDMQLDAGSGGADGAPRAGSFWDTLLNQIRTPGMPALVGSLK